MAKTFLSFFSLSLLFLLFFHYRLGSSCLFDKIQMRMVYVYIYIYIHVCLSKVPVVHECMKKIISSVRFTFFQFFFSVVKPLMSAFEKAKKVNRLHSVKKTTVSAVVSSTPSSTSSTHDQTSASTFCTAAVTVVPSTHEEALGPGTNVNFPSRSIPMIPSSSFILPAKNGSDSTILSTPSALLPPSQSSRGSVPLPTTRSSSIPSALPPRPKLCFYKTYSSFKPSFSRSESSNAIIERGSPALMYFLRPQRGPYHPQPLRVAMQRIQLRAASQRPPSYVSEQEVMDFYRLLDGQYNCSSSSLSYSNTSSSTSSVSSPQGSGYNRMILEGHLPPSGAAEIPPSVVTGGSVFPLPLASPLPQTPSTDDYRIAEMKKNARHIDNNVLQKVCQHFNTSEGCRRGEHCRFLHACKGSLQ